MNTVRRALRHPGVWLGLAGTILLAAGSYALPTVPQNFTDIGVIHQFWWRGRGKGRHAIALGVVLVSVACMMVRPASRRGPINAWVPFALWSAPLLIALPLLSPDLYSYLDYGWIAHQGLDPYRTGLGTVPGPFQRIADPVWRGAIAVYPALSLRLYEGVAAVAGFHVIPAVMLARLPALAGAVLAGLCTPRLARAVGIDPARSLWLVLLNPITIIMGVGGAHNDMLMAGLCVAAAWVAVRGRWGWIGCAALAGLAAGIKQPGFLLALTGAMIATRGARSPRRVAVAAASFGVALAVFVATTLACGLGFGWIRGLAIPSSTTTFAPINVIERFIPLAFQLPAGSVWRLLGYSLMLLASLWFVMRRWEQPFVATTGIFLAYTLLGPNLHAWYLLAPLAFVGLTRPPRWVRALLAGVITYLLLGTVLDQAYRLEPLLCAFVAADVALVLVWVWQNRSRTAYAVALPLDESGPTPAGVVAHRAERSQPHDPVTGELIGAQR